VVVVAAHKEPVHAAHGGPAFEKEDVEVGGVG
jgi:hypothetical protein